MFRAMLLFLTSALMALSCLAAPLTEAQFQQNIEEVREEAGLLALGAVIADAEGDILRLAVTGQRVKGRPDPVQPGDAWHIGSNTKMLTALLYGQMVEQGEADWGATLPDLLPDLADQMDPAWDNVTIEHLLSHRSGLAPNPGVMWFLTSRTSGETVMAQRETLARGFLSRPPEGKTGTFTYSNLGYMIAGAALDRIAVRLGYENYEALCLSTLVPENEGWGFGPPENGIQGHAKGMFGRLTARGQGASADNPRALAPAGTLHVPLAAHARFLSRFLRPDGLHRKLLAPYPDSNSDYALGWALGQHEELGRYYRHAGSNTMWLSHVTLLPEQGLVVIINTNQYSEEAGGAMHALAFDLAQAMRPAD